MIQITRHSERGGCRGYESELERHYDIEKLKSEGFNYFSTYRDTQSEFALSYGKVVQNITFLEEPKRPWQPKPGDRGYDLLC